MRKKIWKDIFLFIIAMCILRGMYFYFVYEPYFSSGFIATVTGSIIGRMIYLKYKE